MLTATGIHAAGGGGGLVKELYRSYVRSSVLGREDNTGAILGKVFIDYVADLM